jgi:hypothetical protein
MKGKGRTLPDIFPLAQNNKPLQVLRNSLIDKCKPESFVLARAHAAGKSAHNITEEVRVRRTRWEKPLGLADQVTHNLH